MWGGSTPIVEASLRRLHPDCIEDPERIRGLLRRAHGEATVFHRGLNARIDLETALLEEVHADRLVLRASNFEPRTTDGQIFLNFSVGERPYFFSAMPLVPFAAGRLELSMPATVFFGERRDRGRQQLDSGDGGAWRVQLDDGAGGTRFGHVQDLSPSGMGVLVQGPPFAEQLRPLTVRFLDGPEVGTERRLELRHQGPADGQQGWLRIGLSRSAGQAQASIDVEHRDQILEGPDPGKLSLDEAELSAASSRVVRMCNESGEEIVALLDSWGEPRGATGVVLPNGWGQTKEALLPLARILVSTFRNADEPILVLRYDGIRRRGESHNDPECLLPGRTDEHFVFSQGVRDLETVVNHLQDGPEFGVSKLVVVSFSAAAIEVRKALALDRSGRVDGWVSVVGSPDLQSMTRAISGGVDFVGGIERGLAFGKQELLGVRVDIDRLGADAAEHSMSFLEDARRDMAEIKVPITWFHGRYDAWVDLDRVRDILSHGDTRKRRLVVLPTGHQLRSSHQARQAFAGISREVALMAKGREMEPIVPENSELRRLRAIEFGRVPEITLDLRAFWRDYLVGRDRSLGIELLTTSSAYRALMQTQLDVLSLDSGQRVLDLGSGTGSFALALAALSDRPADLRVTSIDYVREALSRARQRLAEVGEGEVLAVDHAEVDLDLADGSRGIPLAPASQDRVLASLLLSYLEYPEAVLTEIHRILRPGGLMVISSLCRDADISRLYFEAYAELQVGLAGHELPELQEADLGSLARSFLNDAAKIIEFEDRGAFRFWEPDE
ncbi:MAG: methyltransferase domain-containing protein, partial [Myxococcota bacterium]